METFDAVIIGAGPAGCSAAIYASRASLSTLVLEQGMPGGQIATTDMVENYPGIPSVSGAELGEKLEAHARAAGADVRYGAVEGIQRLEDGAFEVCAGRTSYRAKSVIVACGATSRKAGFDGEEKFRGRGVSYCATCDSMFYRGKRVFVVGGGTSACEEAKYLSHVVSSVEMIVRRDAFRATQGMVDALLSEENVSVRYLTSIVRLQGETLPTTITFRDNATGETYDETYAPGSFGIFVFVGNDPASALVEPYVDIGPDGGVVTDENMATRTPGLFCAGDIRSKGFRQAITAASDGAIAGNAAYRYLEAQGAL